MIVNDIHSRLNETTISGLIEVTSLGQLRRSITNLAHAKGAIAIAGGRHAMGGQQFATGAPLLDTRPLDRVLSYDEDSGLVEVEAGIQWPALRDALSRDGLAPWAIAQKQTGADRFTIGGSVSVNGHGRGLTMPPLVADVESLSVVVADGTLLVCSRTEEPELFALVVGGYGLFGAIYSVTLRLVRSQKLERLVELLDVAEVIAGFEARIAEGFLYGDFQFALDPHSNEFLRRGVFACYRPVDSERPIPADQRALSRKEWQELVVLAHTDKSKAFSEYSSHYLATSGQIYWSDVHQFGDYTDGYHEQIDRALGSPHPATEVIGEIYVPRARLVDFMVSAAEDFRAHDVDVIYGTVRLIERDDDTFLAWAEHDYACVIFNIHTVHTPDGIERTADAFRRLIDLAIDRDGSYFLTYHRYATREQVLACYPQFPSFLREKLERDPGDVFQSDWYRHYRRLFGNDP